ncbi:SDR family oxidoreductase [Candidatus Moduliflexota bacterium]
MTDTRLHVVTGGLGYSGRYIVARLLSEGASVRTITNSAHRGNTFGPRLDIRPMNFDSPDSMAVSLEGASVLYNTYWVRFNHAAFNHASAVENTLRLFEAAQRAGVRRIVHVSITNPSEDSPLEYFRGKAVLERELEGTGVSHAILRPTVLFGKEDILINNIAWVLRRLPAFGIFGDGTYRLQPIYVDDLAALAVEEGKGADNRTINATGPETFTFRELVQTVGRIIGKERPIINVSPRAGYAAGKILGALVGDVLITREEIEGLMSDLLYVNDQPAGTTRLTDWAAANADTLGKTYASELARRRKKRPALEDCRKTG